MSRTGKLVVAGVLVLVLALGGGYLLFTSRTSDSPAPAALDPAPSTTTGQATGTTQADGAATPDGTWQVSNDGSYVGYRVKEQLAFLGSPNEAVGRSTAVTGTMTVAGDTVEAVRIEADLTRLTSDETRRDNAIRERGLESERYPTATLELAEPIKLATAPVQDKEVRGQGKGRLTVHGVTREVDLDLTGRWSGSTIQVVGQLPVKMSDYQIEAPRFGPVVSIEDSMAVDLKLVFERT
jgi:polyisoprenoid-binding protein YceI